MTRGVSKNRIDHCDGRGPLGDEEGSVEGSGGRQFLVQFASNDQSRLAGAGVERTSGLVKPSTADRPDTGCVVWPPPPSTSTTAMTRTTNRVDHNDWTLMKSAWCASARARMRRRAPSPRPARPSDQPNKAVRPVDARNARGWSYRLRRRPRRSTCASKHLSKICPSPSSIALPFIDFHARPDRQAPGLRHPFREAPPRLAARWSH